MDSDDSGRTKRNTSGRVKTVNLALRPWHDWIIIEETSWRDSQHIWPMVKNIVIYEAAQGKRIAGSR